MGDEEVSAWQHRSASAAATSKAGETLQDIGSPAWVRRTPISMEWQSTSTSFHDSSGEALAVLVGSQTRGPDDHQDLRRSFLSRFGA